MQISFALSLPVDAATVPVVRSLARAAMATLGVTDACLADVEVVLTEACTNALRHAGGEDEYQVEMEVNEEFANIRVLDKGRGLDHRRLGGEAAHSSEGGRGILLMRALVDDISFDSRPKSGTVVNLTKRLSVEPDSVLRPTGDPDREVTEPARRIPSRSSTRP